MRRTLRALAALLGYPSAELAAAIPEIRDALTAEGALPRPARRRLDPLLDRLAGAELLDLQADYTELFDRSRALSLHLFEHVHGDSRERGPAMIDLGQTYGERGFLLEGPELPDFVPVFVEFASCLPPDEARAMLCEPVHVLATLDERLAARGSPYAAVLGALTALAGARPDAEALAELAARAARGSRPHRRGVGGGRRHLHRPAGDGRPDRRDRPDPGGRQGDGGHEDRTPDRREGPMNEFLNQLAFGWYPYLAITVLIVGSILRFDKDQYSWRSQSSQFLRRRQMMIGSNLFHLGVIVLFVGHLVGLLTPIGVIDTLGVGHGFKQLAALVVGGIAGVAALVGATLLLHRRLSDPRIRRSSSFADIAVLALIWLQLVLGVGSTWWTIQHLDGAEMVQFMGWAGGILRFDPAAPSLLAETAWIYKLHIILGLTLFLVTPFTRLVHIWSAPIGFVFRPGYQIVRSLAPVRRRPATPTRGPVANGAPATAMRQQAESGQST